MLSTSPADLARAALRRIAELKLPPTPEHFEEHYYAAAGVAPPRRQGEADVDGRELVQRVGEIVTRASTTTGQLVSGLAQGDERLGASLESLVTDTSAGPMDASHLLVQIVESTREIRSTVQASHGELLDTQRSLAEIKAELLESRKLLGQDPLTGSDNRRAMAVVLEREMTRARREGEPLALAMLDIDHFKRINDTLGHDAGDAALVHLTRLAKAMLRGNDAFIRYGGEEFVLVLPETALQGGVFAAERLQLLLAKKPLVYNNQPVMMTFSAGVTVLKDEDGEQSLLRRADAGLYEAKRAGRNRVVAMP